MDGTAGTRSERTSNRLIQMVIAKNLTLAQAWGILDLARTNTTNAVTAFPFVATQEFYTLGFAWEVSKLTANTSVANGGNYSWPPPPANLWQLFWNTIAGWAERAWNAVLAVGAFFAAVGKWLVDAAIGIAYGLATNNWTYFQDKVLKPFVDALSKFIQWVMTLIDTVIRTLFDPILAPFRAMFDRWVGDLSSVLLRVKPGGKEPAGTRGGGGNTAGSESPGILAEALTSLIFLSPIAFLIIGLIVAASFAEKIVWGLTGGIAALASFGIGALVSIIIGLVVTEVISRVIDGVVAADLIPPWFDAEVDWSFTLLDFVFLYFAKAAIRARNIKSLVVEDSMSKSVTAILLLSVATTIQLLLGDTVEALIPMLIIDLMSFWLSMEASVVVRAGVIRQQYPLLHPIAVAIFVGSLATSILSMYDDGVKLGRLLTNP